MGGRACARGAYRHYLVLNQVEGSLDIHPLFAVQGVGVYCYFAAANYLLVVVQTWKSGTAAAPASASASPVGPARPWPARGRRHSRQA